MKYFRAAALWLALAPALLHAQTGTPGFECLIEPSQVVEVRTSVEGIVAQVHVQRGDAVRRGQVLVELQSAVERAAVDSAAYRAKMEGQIAAARNRLEFSGRKLSRANDLHAQNFTSGQLRDDAEAERRLAEAELQAAVENRELAIIEHRRAAEQLALRTMVSPFNGVVLDRLLNPGDLAEAGTGRKPVLKLARIDPLRVDVVLPAALFGQVRPGRQANVVPQTGGGRYGATVKMVDKVIDSASGTFVARLELPNPQQTLPAGMRCTAEIEGLAPAARPKS